MEAVTRQATELQTPAKPYNPVGKITSGRRNSASDKRVPPPGCYRCGKSGHHPDQCFTSNKCVEIVARRVI